MFMIVRSYVKTDVRCNKYMVSQKTSMDLECFSFQDSKIYGICAVTFGVPMLVITLVDLEFW